jgi:aryl-alcohol dehydrogenase-like predicted oxidoreductase
MQRRRLGKNGPEVSLLGLGTTGWGAHPEFGTVDAAGAARHVAHALDHGINLFDTAETYGDGECEQMLGAALGPRRQEAVIATKVFFGVSGDSHELGLSRRHVIAMCEGSLRRLGTDYVDILQMHGWDGLVPVEETLEACDSLVRDGKVRFIGVSNWSAWHLMKALGVSERDGLPRFVAQQIYYSLQAREAEFELIPAAIDQGLGVLVWSPLAGALLTGRWRRDEPPPRDSRRVIGWPDPPIYDEERLWATIEVLIEIAENRRCTASQVALAYLLRKPGVTSLIIGARNDRQLAANLPAADLELDPHEMERLDAVSRPPLLYPYWWQAKYNDRLGEADLSLLAAYRGIPIPDGSIHRPLPGFGTIPGAGDN